MTYAPLRSVTSAPSGAFSSDSGPAHTTRPSSTSMAACATGARSPPSISVKLRTTSTSLAVPVPTETPTGIEQPEMPPPPEPQLIVNSASRRVPSHHLVVSAFRRTLCRLRPSIFKNPFGAGGIEDAARAEARERGRRLIGRAAVLLDEVDHLLRQRVADHAVPAHRRQHHHLRVRHLVGLTLEAERVADAVPWNARVLAAVLGAADRRRHVDAQAKILFPDPLDELLR